MPALTCCICRASVAGAERFVLARGGREEVHCSQACLAYNLDARRRGRAAVKRRWLLRAAALAAVLIAAPKLWHRIRVPRAQTISFVQQDLPPAPPPRAKSPFEGPAWPPTEDDWLFAFRNTAWTYPLPGPTRRPPKFDERTRTVELGGELWGEHVYAVHEGTVDQIQKNGGEVSLRLVHFGGMVFTHYQHLAAVPRWVRRGAPVKPGDVIGLLGDTGDEHPGRYVRFALSIRPSAALPETTWDPRDLMSKWPLVVPSHGTVAGFVPSQSDLAIPLVAVRRRAK